MRRILLRWFPALALMALISVLAPASAGAQCQASSNCYPPNPCILASGPAVGYGATPIQIRNVSMQNPSHCVAPPAPAATVNSFFDVFVELDLSQNGGGTFGPAAGTAHCTVGMLGLGGVPPVYQTEMLQLDLSGGSFPAGMMLRESPTKASSGQTTITDLGGGQFRIDSFFDVFTELSLDGGQTWTPSNSSQRVTENPYSPTAAPHASWGAIKILYR